MRSSIQTLFLTDEATEFRFTYDPAGQLLDAVLRGVTTQTAAQSYRYGYDTAGNRTKEIVGSAFTEETTNIKNLNQLGTRGSGTVLPIRGTTNEAVSVRGDAGHVVMRVRRQILTVQTLSDGAALHLAHRLYRRRWGERDAQV